MASHCTDLPPISGVSTLQISISGKEILNSKKTIPVFDDYERPLLAESTSSKSIAECPLSLESRHSA